VPQTAVAGSNAVPYPHGKRRAGTGRTRHRASLFESDEYQMLSKLLDIYMPELMNRAT
jgi:hypothetical protein